MTRTGIARLRTLACIACLIAPPLLRAQVTCNGMIFTNGFELPLPASVLINEIASNPVDWVELYNPGNADIDVGGWSISDNDDTHVEILPEGTVIPMRCYLTYYVSLFGLGSADSARLRDPGSQLLDAYTWSTHPTASYSRCPNGSGPFANAATATPGAANSCP